MNKNHGNLTSHLCTSNRFITKANDKPALKKRGVIVNSYGIWQSNEVAGYIGEQISNTLLLFVS